MSTRKDNSVWTVLCCRVKETTHVSTRKQLVQMFWTDSESAMIMKLFRGHCLRPHRWSHLGDAFMQPRKDPPPQLSPFNHLPLPIVGSDPVLTMSKSQNFLRSPQCTRQQISEQDTENHSSLHSHSELGERHPDNPTSLSDWQVCLWRPWLASGSHTSSRLKCASSCLGPDLFQISGVVCTN